MAEGVGFEPTIRFPVYTLSKRAPSATRPSLQRRQAGVARHPSGPRPEATALYSGAGGAEAKGGARSWRHGPGWSRGAVRATRPNPPAVAVHGPVPPSSLEEPRGPPGGDRLNPAAGRAMPKALVLALRGSRPHDPLPVPLWRLRDPRRGIHHARL